jgi:hypothetical protein
MTPSSWSKSKQAASKNQVSSRAIFLRFVSEDGGGTFHGFLTE